MPEWTTVEEEARDFTSCHRCDGEHCAGGLPDLLRRAVAHGRASKVGFTDGEVCVLDFILSTLLRGGSPSAATRSEDFASLCRKVVVMKVRRAAAIERGEGEL